MPKDTSARSASEREWIGAAVRRRREELGLRQKDAAELISAAGPHVTQQVLAKIEKGEKLLELGELLAVCIALDTSLDRLLFPTDAPEVKPELVRFASGRELPTGYLHAVLLRERIDGSLVEVEEAHAPKRASVVRVPEVLDLRSEYVGDPGAVAVGEILGLEAAEVTELVRKHSRRLIEALGLPSIVRRKITATDLLAVAEAAWRSPDGSGDTIEDLSPVGRRQVRTALTRDLADALEVVIGR